MPIEIKELHIKAVVQDNVKPVAGSNGSIMSSTQLNAIIAQCVEQVLHILKEKQER